MNIGEASRATGISSKMIRHYEAIGLLSRQRRTASGYRDFDGNDIHTLRFIRQARDAGFSTPEIKRLLSLWVDKHRPAGEVRRLALEHLKALESKIAELRAMAATLNQLIDRCQGDDRPECPILDALAGDVTSSSRQNSQRTVTIANALTRRRRNHHE
ncbi:Cu(I)-responsive transcriptional regulator [Methyloterricola oryzae]|uniref:Cu(I)-responsive transcriptional regulator n=1 Tax=Methyloterricola oryzae TaxID=1495050 RepID=UPI0005EB598D|nr:Cu(I)-responsive transcriptional regulator [Methyloterricola oryzae]